MDGPIPTSGVSARMARQRRRDTAPEMALRRELHRRGFRYRVDQPVAGLPRRRADLIFAGARLAVFVDGCFWHSCPQHGTAPIANETWWAQKLARNVARDRETGRALAALGWTVVRVWEHDDPIAAADAVASALAAGLSERAKPTHIGS